MNNNQLYTAEYIHDTVMADPGHFWRKVQRARDDYACLNPHPVVPSDFQSWLLNQYGIQLVPARDGGIHLANTYNIVDEQKYLIFELRYSG